MSDVLTEKQIDSYRENGFLVVEGLFDAGLVERARGTVDRLLSGPDLGAVAEHGRLLDAVADLIGEDWCSTTRS